MVCFGEELLNSAIACELALKQMFPLWRHINIPPYKEKDCNCSWIMLLGLGMARAFESVKFLTGFTDHN